MPESWLQPLSDDQQAWLGALWGKSDRGRGHHLLVQHLFDAMAVGEILWGRFLAPGVRRRLDAVSGGRGQELLAWVCGLHDLGKVSVAFQAQDEQLWAGVESAGLPVPEARPRSRESQRWRHDLAGAAGALSILRDEWGANSPPPDGAGLDGEDAVAWIWPLIAGHHGVFPSIGSLRVGRGRGRALHGEGLWDDARHCLLHVVTEAAGFASVKAARPPQTPTRADQLALAGYVVMADWIASHDLFEPVSDISQVGPRQARDRAARAWQLLGLSGGWGQLPVPDGDVVEARFGMASHPSQSAAVAAARRMGSPGLLVVEAPMGEGKTEGALAAAEVLAARFGADGVMLGMPTQATADPMLDRLLPWLAALDPAGQVALAHGRTHFNRSWAAIKAKRDALQAIRADDDGRDSGALVDEYGEAQDWDAFDGGFHDIALDGIDGEHECDDTVAAAEWFFGRSRTLLAPHVVGTVDQALYAATRTRFVSLRFAGLAGKVVVLDEVHAADEFMTEFLVELLRWLGGAGVPVVLLSATLHPRQRERLVGAYLDGAAVRPPRPVAAPQPLPGYPAITAAWVEGGEDHREVTAVRPARADTDVALELVEEPVEGAHEALAQIVATRVDSGGTVLVIQNTVDRAQQVYRALNARLGEDVVLLHSRFTASDRSRIARQLLDELGRDGSRRPPRRVIVATQIAEQSFDVDVDLLVTDLAPIDLMLQRVGRLHRHQRAEPERGDGMAEPRVIITGFRRQGADLPWFPRGAEAIYGRHRLLRALAMAQATSGGAWSLPSTIADLVADAYGDDPPLPDGWRDDEAATRSAWEADASHARGVAAQSRLAGDGEATAPTLAGLHRGGLRSRDVETHVNVRQGDMGEEILLLRRVGGRLQSMDGHDLGLHGEGARDLGVEVLGGTVRLPSWPPAIGVAARQLVALPEWRDHPWLRHARVLELAGSSAVLGGYVLAYDSATGLTIDKERR